MVRLRLVVLSKILLSCQTAAVKFRKAQTSNIIQPIEVFNASQVDINNNE